MITVPLLKFFLPFHSFRVKAGIMRWVVLSDTACNFNAFISNQSMIIFNCLITGASTLETVFVH